MGKDLNSTKDMINESLIKQIISQNYHVLLAFDLSEGNLTWKEYMKKLREHKN